MKTVARMLGKLIAVSLTATTVLLSSTNAFAQSDELKSNLRFSYECRANIVRWTNILTGVQNEFGRSCWNRFWHRSAFEKENPDVHVRDKKRLTQDLSFRLWIMEDFLKTNCIDVQRLKWSLESEVQSIRGMEGITEQVAAQLGNICCIESQMEGELLFGQDRMQQARMNLTEGQPAAAVRAMLDGLAKLYDGIESYRHAAEVFVKLESLPRKALKPSPPPQSTNFSQPTGQDNSGGGQQQTAYSWNVITGRIGQILGLLIAILTLWGLVVNVFAGRGSLPS